MGRWRVKERMSEAERHWEASSTKRGLYLDGDYSHWSLENHITFPHLLKDSEGEGGTGDGRVIIRRYHFHPSSDEGKSGTADTV